MGHFPLFSARLSSLSIACLGLLSVSAYADEAQGLAWLQNQSQSEVTASTIANGLQALSETSLTLNRIAGSNTSFDVSELQTKTHSTESLARFALLAHFQNTDAAAKAVIWTQLNDRQNEDGGFGHLQGWQSNPLDTAFVLLALTETGYIDSLSVTEQQAWQDIIAKALNYLATQQRTDGSYQVVSLDTLYVSSYVLSALSGYVQVNPYITPKVQSLVTFLTDKQLSAGKWSEHPQGLFIDALVSESLHPYSDGNTAIQDAFKQRALAVQQADGSWENDAYVTAVVLDSLNQQSKDVTNPISSSIALSVVDAETNLPLQGATLTSTGSSPSQVSITSDGDGKLAISNAKAGLYQFELQRAGYISITFEVNLKQGEQLNVNKIKLSRDINANTAQVQGQVTDSVSGVGISNAQVTIVMVDDNGKPLPNLAPLIVKTGTDGSYQAILPQAGKFGIDVRKDGFFPVNGSGSAKAGGVALFSTKLINQDNFSASLQGSVTDTQGQPLANVTIINSNDQTIATTNAQGKFMVNGLNAGAQQWQVKRSGYLTATINMVVDKSKAYDVGTVTLIQQGNNASLATGKITVSATDGQTNRLINGTTITAEKIIGGQITQKQTFTAPDNAGGVAAINLPTGDWKVTLSHPAYQPVNQTFTITKDITLTYNPSMSLKPYTVTGKVVDSITNESIANAPITLLDDNDAVLYTGQTDNTGRFIVSNSLTQTNIKIKIAPAQYLSTVRYMSREVASDDSTQMDIGEIRLRPKSAQVVLPDLAITQTDSGKLKTDQQNLTTSGELTATIINKGDASLSSNDIKITAFEDTNYNRKLDADEVVYGEAIFNTQLAKDQSTDVILSISGKSKFRDAPIAIMVDSDKEIAEKDEKNNVRYTFEASEIKPPQGTLEAEVVWGHDNPNNSGSNTGSVAAPLEDTNGDGKIGYGDVSTIIVNDSKWYRFYNGASGELTNGYRNYGNKYDMSIAAIADLDNDNIPEVIIKHSNYNYGYDIHVLSNKAQLLKHIPVPAYVDNSSYWASHSSDVHVADLDKDGTPDIVMGPDVFNYQNGTSARISKTGNVQAIADINNDGYLDLIGTKGTTDRTGTQLYNFHDKTKEYEAKFLAVGDVLNTGQPQIISIIKDEICIFDASNGSLITKFSGTSKAGGSPVIADFDGDGVSDIGLAQQLNFVALRGDGSVIWSTPIIDYSGGTGATVFDFDNDGNTEAIHTDQEFLRVYDAKTGVERIKIENITPTGSEYPIVGDFDADGSADIVVTGTYGTRMISSKNKDWANTRNIWNQYSYHVTNINDDLSVPKNEPNSWEVHNTYRANLLLNQNATAASDLTASYIRVTDRSIIGDSEFTVRVGNAGGKPVKAGTPVSFYRIPKSANGSTATPELVGTVALSKTLVGGNISESYEDVTLTYSGSLADFGEVVIVANDAGAGLDSATGIPVGGDADSAKVIREYSRDNNTARLAVDGGWVSLTLDGSVDKTAYAANKDVTITAIPSNLGSFTSAPIVKTQIIDSAGNVVATLPDQPVDLTSALIPDADNSKTLTQTWNTGTHRTGNYQARITLWRKPLTSSELELVATVDRPFSIITEGAALGLTDATITTDKVNYTANDLVSINSRLQNKAANQVATKRDVTVDVKDPDGKVIFTQSYSYDELAPNALRDQAFELSLKDAKAGSYTVTQTVVSPDGSQANQVSSTTFGVQSSAQSGIGIAGSIAADKAQVELGNNVTLNWSINNTGDVDLTGLPIRIELFKGDSQTAFATIPVNPADIAKGDNLAKSVMWNAVGNNNDQITAVLVATFGSNGQTQDKGLAVTNFTLIEPPIEAVINQTDAITDPVLVYYSCESGWYTFAQNWSLGQFNYPCFDVRENILKDYLTRLAVPYKLVKTPWEFRHELQSGKFDNIWLLGAVEKLSPHTYKELREAAFMGDNVLVDSGMHSWLNHKLFHLAGMNYRGRLQLALPKDGGGDITLNPPLFTDPVLADLVSIPLSTQTRRKGYPLESNWAVLLEKRPTDSRNTQVGDADVTATFNGAHKLDIFLEWIERTKKGNEDNYYNQTLQSYPAITQGTYGKGKPVALSFDLIHSLSLATSNGTPTPTQTRPNLSEQRWDGALKQLLKPRQVNASNYLPLEPVRIPVVVNNKGSNDKTVTVTVEMPQGAMWLDSKGGATLADAVQLKPSHIQGTHSYQVTVPAKSQHSDILTLRLPKGAGTHGVRVTVSTDQNGTTRTLDQQELRYVVRGVQERIDLLKSTVDGWSVFSQNGFQVLNLKTQLGLIKSHYKNGNLELAVYEAARMGTTFSEMQNTSDRDIKALRLEGDELLRALQMQWYQSRNNVTPLP